MIQTLTVALGRTAKRGKTKKSGAATVMIVELTIHGMACRALVVAGFDVQQAECICYYTIV
jgi:hypothetical protein